MKRILLVVAAFTLFASAGFTGSAKADGHRHHGHGHAHGHHHHQSHYCYHCRCHHAHGQCRSGHHHHYQSRPIYGGHAPYGAGYSGGWQPYQGGYYRQPGFGLYIGF